MILIEEAKELNLYRENLEQKKLEKELEAVKNLYLKKTKSLRKLKYLTRRVNTKIEESNLKPLIEKETIQIEKLRLLNLKIESIHLKEKHFLKKKSNEYEKTVSIFLVRKLRRYKKKTEILNLKYKTLKDSSQSVRLKEELKLLKMKLNNLKRICISDFIIDPNQKEVKFIKRRNLIL